jgi:hypothetical protein
VGADTQFRIGIVDEFERVDRDLTRRNLDSFPFMGQFVSALTVDLDRTESRRNLSNSTDEVFEDRTYRCRLRNDWGRVTDLALRIPC